MNEIRCDNITEQNSIDIILNVLELKATIAPMEQKNDGDFGRVSKIMWYLYLDESGDLGFDFQKKNPSQYFTVCILEQTKRGVSP